MDKSLGSCTLAIDKDSLVKGLVKTCCKYYYNFMRGGGEGGERGKGSPRKELERLTYLRKWTRSWSKYFSNGSGQSSGGLEGKKCSIVSSAGGEKRNGPKRAGRTLSAT